MENNMYEQGSGEQQTVTVPAAKPRKKKTLVLVFVLVLVAAVLVAGGLYAFLNFVRISPQVNNISKDALLVARIDLPRILLKADIEEFKKDSVNSDLLKALEELNMDDLVKNPKETGLFTDKPWYFFLDHDAKSNDINGYFVLPLANATKFTKFVKGIDFGDDDVAIKEKEGKWLMQLEDTPGLADDLPVAFAWDKQSIILGMTMTEEFEEEQFKTKYRALEKKVLSLLDQPRNNSIASNGNYNKAVFRNHDMMLWVNTDQLATIAEKGLKDAKPRVKEMVAQRIENDSKRESYSSYMARRDAYDRNWEPYYYDGWDYVNVPYNPPQWNDFVDETPMDYPDNIFETVLLGVAYRDGVDHTDKMDDIIAQVKELKGSSYMVYSDFLKGKVVAGIKSTLSPEQIKKYKEVFTGTADTKALAKYLPQDQLIGSAMLRINWPAYWKVTSKQLKDIFGDDLFPRKKELAWDMTEEEVEEDDMSDFLWKQLPKLCDGSALASINVGSGKDKVPFVTVALSIKNNSGVKEIIKRLEKDGEYDKDGKIYKGYNDAFMLEDDALVWTSDYKQYKKCSYGLSNKDQANATSSVFGMFFDFTKMLEFVDDMDDDAKDIFEQFADTRISTKMQRGYPSDVTWVLNLKDKKQNSLKVIWETIPNKDEMFEDMVPSPRSRGNRWEEQEVDTTVVYDEYYDY